MKKALPLALVVALLVPLGASCIVRTGRDRTVYRERGCPGGFHWERGACVKNGHGKHKGKHKH